MGVRINVVMNDPYLEMQGLFSLLLTIHNHIFLTGMALNENSFKDYFAYVTFQSNTSAIFLCPEANEQFITIKDWFQQLEPQTRLAPFKVHACNYRIYVFLHVKPTQIRSR